MPALNRGRVDETGVYYHIYNKGIEEKIIFSDEEDYKVFLSYLEDYLASPKDPESVKKVFEIHGRKYRGTPHQPKNYFHKVELIAYSLMPDHFHLLLRPVAPNTLGKFMRSLCTRYSMYFNKKYTRRGTLFEGPYKSIPVRSGERFLPYLTHFFHHSSSHSSYPEYLGSRTTSWIKSQVVLSLFDKGASSYKDFVDRYKLDQKQKELIDSLTFSDDTACIERSDPTSTEKIKLYADLKPRSRVPHFLALSCVFFLLLVTLGVRNIQVSNSNRPQSLPTPQILSETEEATPQAQLEATPEAILKTIVTVKLIEASLSANIRQEPNISSGTVGLVHDGETLEFISKSPEWYQVKLKDGSTGFISASVVTEEEATNE